MDMAIDTDASTKHEARTMTTDSDPPDDPLITKYVEAALEVCVGHMPAEELEALRARLYVFYETNPEAVALLDEIRAAEKPTPAVVRSGETTRRDPAVLKDAIRFASRGGKGGRQ